jgi:CheY-like chemotaxis protein
MEQPLKIEVVDDERLIATTLVAILEHQGYRAVAAFDGQSAIETARTFRPDCLLSDVVMPGLNGVEAAIRILEFLPDCKVLFLSGQAHSVDLLEGARARGFNFDIVNKPVFPTELLGIIAELLAIQPGGRSLVILNVDDDEIQRYAISRLLSQAGFTVREAATGNEALRLATSKPDLILLDINLPDISGFEVCKRLKASPETATIPVVHLTNTYRDEASKAMSRELGAEEYVTHPVEPGQLFSKLRAIIEAKRR